ncbi:MAG TPA: hypothetical protein EYP55_06930, partial [Anaerolineae bacterium]|nr:hypothetical protein [Anaerolineae bacterium]
LPNPPFISISSQVIPEFREYERTSTVVVNAYVGPFAAQQVTHLSAAFLIKIDPFLHCFTPPA